MTRIQSSAIISAIDQLDQLRETGELAAEHPKTIARIQADARAKTFAAHGQAITAFSQRWTDLRTAQEDQRLLFRRREASFTGRMLNIATTCPRSNIKDAAAHIYDCLFSSNTRHEKLTDQHRNQNAELAAQQAAYTRTLAQPHQQLLQTDLKDFARDFMLDPRPRARANRPGYEPDDE